MSVSLLVCAMAWLASPFVAQPESLLKKYIPRPTGANAYEEYLAAADLVRVPGLSTYEAFISLRGRFSPTGMARNRGEEFPKLPPGLHVESTTLDARREILRRYGRVVDLIHVGNSKPAIPFRPTFDFDSPLDEVAPYRSIGRVLDSAAHVAFVDGNSNRATEVLLDSVFFSRAIGGDTLIHYLVGTANCVVALARFEQNLTRLSERDTDRIIDAVEDSLKRTDPLIMAMEGEKKGLMASAKQLTDPATYDLERDFGSELERRQHESFLAFVKTMSPAEREVAQGKIIERGSAAADRVIKVLKGPESQWCSIEDSPEAAAVVEVKTLDQFIASASEHLQPVHKQVIFASVRMRTQLRLLRLHAKILRFKMEFERLPDNLAECCAAADLDDPLSGKPFQYEVKDPSQYRLYSMGVPGIGEIELRYRRQSEPDPNLPPQSFGYR
ncbi:MAG: hypothetical protein K1X67_14970 [Fimbriimonadaceae bacterium]|nr:hypothetical protein [Fimbriimonadaceae bacterium]